MSTLFRRAVNSAFSFAESAASRLMAPVLDAVGLVTVLAIVVSVRSEDTGVSDEGV